MGLGWIIGAIAWGAAEASIFFIVPDVLLTAALLRLGMRRALVLAALAALAAVVAGYFLWGWGGTDLAAARRFLLQVPALGSDLIARVEAEMTVAAWPWHLLLGSVTGVPFKIYAVEAGAAGIGAMGFFAVGLAARFLRFALSIGLVALGRAALAHFGLAHWAGRLLALAWTGVYAVYFTWRAGGI